MLYFFAGSLKGKRSGYEIEVAHYLGRSEYFLHALDKAKAPSCDAELRDALETKQLEFSCSGRGMRNRLLTFAEIDLAPGAFDFWLSPVVAHKKLFVDSGAFSAKTLGVTVDLGRYIEWLKERLDKIYCYASLDVIGDAQGTIRNYELMKKAGLTPIPTFHIGSDLKILERYCESAPLVALGGLVSFKGSESLRVSFLDSCFRIFKKYWPIKVHAFGMTGETLLCRYPFFSCDSSSAIVGRGFGQIVRFARGKIKTKSWRDAAKEGRFPELADGLLSKYRHAARRSNNVKEFLKYEQYITALWKKRGIVWDEKLERGGG